MIKLIVGIVAAVGIGVLLLAQPWFILLVLQLFAWSANLPWPPGGIMT